MFFKKILNSYIFILLLAIVLGLLFSNIFIYINKYSLFFVQIIFLLSSLKIIFSDILKEFKVNIKEILTINLLNLFIIPIIFFYVFKIFFSELSLEILILLITPIGTTTPFFVEILKGNVKNSFVLTITSSILSTISIPLILTLLKVGDINGFNILYKIFLAIIIPFVLSQIIRFLLKNKLEKTYKYYSHISRISLFLIISSAIAINKNILLKYKITELLKEFAIIIGVFILLFIIGNLIYKIFKKQDKISIYTSFIYMNFSLAIYIYSNYFINNNKISFLILSIIPWSLSLPIIKKYYVE